MRQKEINKLCQRCSLKCKQLGNITLISCPNFEYKPQQIKISFSYKKKNIKNQIYFRYPEILHAQPQTI